MKRLHPPPALGSIDELAADPTAAGSLSPAAANAVALRCLTVLAAIQPARSDARGPEAEEGAPDRLIGATAVARLVGMSRSWVEKHVESLPPRRSVAGAPRWLLSEIEAWVRGRPLYGKAFP